MGYENVLLIVIAAGLILFGSKKLPALFRSLGRAQVESEKARLEAKLETNKMDYNNSSPTDFNIEGNTRTKLEEIAIKVGFENPSLLSDEELREKILQRIKS
jgi:Sec-independent protein translocase protein TatA